MKEPVNAWTHFVTLIAAVIGFVLLMVFARRSLAGLFVVGVYGASMVALYTASTMYHWWRTTARREMILKRLDHGSINLLIAGSATPIFYYGLQGAWRTVMLAVVWVLAVLCGVIQVVFIRAPRWLHTILYLMLGWVAIVPLPQLIRHLSLAALVLLGAGGLSYSVGAVVYATKKPNFIPGKFGFHEVFHLFVATGTIAHFVAILLVLLPQVM
jgi:hemolysin III